MSEYAKPTPIALRQRSTIATANIHQALSNSHAGPSGTSFRSQEGPNGARQALQNQEYLSFANSQHDHEPLAKASLGEADTIFASSWTREALQPRPEDVAGVFEILSRPSVWLSPNEEIEDTLSGQSQRWRNASDQVIPKDPILPSSSALDNFPYLQNLLSLPEDQSIPSYLDLRTYTEDVWSLPLTLQQDLDCVKSKHTNGDVREIALKRLQMLKRHLEAKISDDRVNGSLDRQITLADLDWEAIWSNERIGGRAETKPS